MHDPIKDTIRELRLPRPPFWMVAILLMAVVASWIPLVHIARSSVTRSPDRPIHMIQDMDKQAKLKAQRPSIVFEDGRSLRPVVPGTIAREQILGDDHYTQGYTLKNGKADYFDNFPQQIDVNAALLERGQQRFNINCSHCHGWDGSGNGIVNQRALKLVEAGVLNQSLPKTQWVQVTNLSQIKEDSGELKFGEKEGYSNGKLFNTMTNGLNNMPALGSQISIDDRWAIVAYVRALQASQTLTDEQKP